MIKRKGGQFEWLEARDGPVAGPMPGVAFKEGTTRLEPGDELFFYTDGVTEADNSQRELFGNDRLKAVLDQSKSAVVDDRVYDVMQAVKAFAVGVPQADDITVMALRFNGAPYGDSPIFQQTMVNQLAAIPPLQEAFEHYVSQWEGARPLMAKINMALDDLLSNVVQHAFPDDESEHHIEVRGEVVSDSIVLTITDDGIPFNPLTVEAPDITLPLDKRDIGGLGIHLVKSMFDEVAYHRKVDHNVLTVKKKFSS